jgi:hypothetical protein
MPDMNRRRARRRMDGGGRPHWEKNRVEVWVAFAAEQGATAE